MDRHQHRQRIGDRIREIRGEMTQRELAEKSGLTITTIVNIEKGKFPAKLDTLQQIADIFGKRVEIL